MKRTPIRILASSSAVALIMAGCNTTSTHTRTASSRRDVHHFAPSPQLRVGAQALAPMKPGPLEHVAGDPKLFGVPYPLPDRVNAEIEEIQHLYPNSFQKGLDRSSVYLPYIKSELQKAGLPEELAWVVMVESQFTPKIVSRAGAGGMWQFMKSTGLRYNMRIDNYVDERFDWQTSTRTAIAYLRDLYDYFGGSWPLAISAYNMGENGLARAIAANGGQQDLWQLLDTEPASNMIQQETKKYYPRFLASLIVATNPAKYGFHVAPQPADSTERIPVDGMYALDDVDQMLGYSSGTLARLNPGLIQEVTPPSGQFNLAIPAGSRDKVLAALKATGTVKELMAGGTHKVRRGETLQSLADRYQVAPKDLLKLNKMKTAFALHAGQTIQVPGVPSLQPNLGMRTAAAGEVKVAQAEGGSESLPPAVASPKQKTYVVRRGDTLYDIAKMHGVSMANLQEWNHFDRRHPVEVGDRVIVSGDAAAKPEPAETPKKQDAAPAPAPAKKEVEVAQKKGAKVQVAAEPPAPAPQHEIKQGEYPAKIARIYGVSVDDLLKWNHLDNDSTVKVGEKLIVGPPSAGKKELASNAKKKKVEPKTITYTVAKGDTPGKIAEKYGTTTGDLLQSNKLSNKSLLRVGQTLTVPNPAANGAPEPAPVEVASAKKGARKDTEATPANNTKTKLAKVDVSDMVRPEKGVPKPAAKAADAKEKAETKSASAKPAAKGKAKAPKDVTHIVGKGQNPSNIADKYDVNVDDLFKWNNWNKKHVLQPGEKVIIKK